VLAMQWRDLDLDRMTWTIPNPKARVPYVVPLVEEAKEILKRRPKSSEWVFPSHGKTGHLVELKRAWRQLLDRAQIRDLHIHDLRRTLGSWQAGLGASLSVIGKSLGHTSTQSTEAYARLDLAPVRASVAAATEAMIAAAKKKPRQLSVGGGA
jgi:integrase